MTTSTYSPTFLPSPYLQQGPYWQAQQQPGQFGWGGTQPGIDQFIPSIQLVVQLLSNAQQHIWTAQHIVAQLPQQLASLQQQPYQQFGQQQSPYQQFGQQFGQQRPYAMGW